MLQQSSILLAAALGLAACETRPAPEAASPAPAALEAPEAPDAEPRLVVLIVIDQLPSWRFSQDVALLDGGIARLVRGGAYYPFAELPYAATFTAPGHAAIGTGAPPAVTGILANSWFRRELGEVVDATEDAAYPVFRLAGGVSDEGVAPTALRVEGVADALASQRAGARSVAVGLKDRAATLMLGQHPDLAVFYDADQIAMTTSRYYADAMPDWLARLGAEHPIAPRLDHRWVPSDAALLERAVGPDDGAGEGSFFGLDSTFPHDLGDSDQPHEALMATPLGTAITFETALAAVEGEGLGDDDVPDVLAVTISTHDYAGHVWGQESWERLDLLLRLDHQLGEFLEALDTRVGQGRYAVVLTSDHGATPMVERSVAAGAEAYRCEVDSIIAAAQQAAETVLGQGSWVIGTWANTIYLSDAFQALANDQREQTLEAIVEAVRAVQGVGFIARTDELVGDCDAHDDPIAAMACRSLRARESGAVFCSMGSLSVPKADFATGTSHGSPNPEDRTVPIAVYGPGIGPRVDARAVSLLQVAPTLAELLGIEPPEAAEAPPL